MLEDWKIPSKLIKDPIVCKDEWLKKLRCVKNPEDCDENFELGPEDFMGDQDFKIYFNATMSSLPSPKSVTDIALPILSSEHICATTRNLNDQIFRSSFESFLSYQ